MFHALQVHPQCEQRVEAALLPEHEGFYPWRETQGRIGNHDRRLRKPWFPGYVFARFPNGDQSRILSIRHVVRIIGIVPEIEIESVRRLALSKVPIMEHPRVQVGETVRLTNGILAGVEGQLIRFQPKGLLLVVTIQAIDKTIAASIEPEWIEKVKAAA